MENVESPKKEMVNYTCSMLRAEFKNYNFNKGVKEEYKTRCNVFIVLRIIVDLHEGIITNTVKKRRKIKPLFKTKQNLI